MNRRGFLAAVLGLAVAPAAPTVARDAVRVYGEGGGYDYMALPPFHPNCGCLTAEFDEWVARLIAYSFASSG